MCHMAQPHTFEHEVFAYILIYTIYKRFSLFQLDFMWLKNTFIIEGQLHLEIEL